MNRKRAIRILACFFVALLGIGVIALWPAPSVHPVTIGVKSASLTHDLQPMADFVFTNAGAKPVKLSIFLRADRETNGGAGLCVRDSFSLPAGTNRTLRLRGPSHSGPWRIQAWVFESASPLVKAKFALRRLGKFLCGKGAFGSIGSWNMVPAAYEISSPVVSEIPRPASSATPAGDWMEPEAGPLKPSGLGGLMDGAGGQIIIYQWAPPSARPKDSPAKPVEDSRGTGGSRPR